MGLDDGKKPAEKIQAALEHIKAIQATAGATSAPNEDDEPRKPMAQGQEDELTDIISLIEELIAEIDDFLKTAEGDISGLLFSLLGSLEIFLNNLLAVIPL